MFTNGNMDRDVHLLFNNPGILQGPKKITPWITGSSDSPRD